MLETVKVQLLNLIKSLDYHITDNGRYEESFPWLMLRTQGRKFTFSQDIKFDIITFVIDIFSTYPGEKEIIDICDDILEHLPSLREENPSITNIALKRMNILDDNATGPVRKHGVLTFDFILTSGWGTADD